MLTINTVDGKTAIIKGGADDINGLSRAIKQVSQCFLDLDDTNWYIGESWEKRMGGYIEEVGQTIAFFLKSLLPPTNVQTEIEVYWPFLLIDLVIIRQLYPSKLISKQNQAHLLGLEVAVEAALLEYNPTIGQQCLNWLGSYTLDMTHVGGNEGYLLEFIWYRTMRWVITYKPGLDSFRRLPGILRGFRVSTTQYENEFFTLITRFPHSPTPGYILPKYSTAFIMRHCGLQQIQARQKIAKPKYHIRAMLLDLKEIRGKDYPADTLILDQYDFMATNAQSASRGASQWFHRNRRDEQETLPMAWQSLTSPNRIYCETKFGLLVVMVVAPEISPDLEEFIGQVRQESYRKKGRPLKELVAEFVPYRMRQQATRQRWWIFPDRPDQQTFQEFDLLYDLDPEIPAIMAQAAGIDEAELGVWLSQSNLCFRCPECGSVQDDTGGIRVPGGYSVDCYHCSGDVIISKEDLLGREVEE